MSSMSSSYIEQINTKSEALRLIKDPCRLFSLLYSKYGDIEEDLYLLFSNQLVYNLPTKLNCVYKELKYSYIQRDYLKRLYKLNESFSRLPKLNDYYKNYHLFFCRPTLRHNKLGKIMCNFQDKKAEIFYKNNYKESKDIISMDKEENNYKKNSSLSLTSFDNITNNKIIFDKHTKKMLDKSETELKNNNYYNTLVLETPRSINFSNNGLISKRTGDSNSFEKCIHALVEYQYYKNKKIKIKNEKKENVKNKKIKNFLINNEKNSCKFYKIINNISQSHRITNKSVNHKMYYQKGKLYNKYIMINSSNSSYINNSIGLNKINKAKKKKKSLYSLTKYRYNTSSGTTLRFKINQTNANLENNLTKKIKEITINYPTSTTNKDSKNNKSNIIQNNSVTNSNYNRFTKFTEILNQSQKRQEKFQTPDNQNIYFNFINNKKNRITKKKVKINKNLKVNITQFSTQNIKKSKHIKNKTVDFNNSNNTNNYTKADNIIFTEEFNASIKKNPKKQIFIINIDNNNYQKKNPSNHKNSKKIIKVSSPISNKLYNKISVTQTNSKEKNNRTNFKHILPLNINSSNKQKDNQNLRHRKNNKSLIINDNINNTFNISKSLKVFGNNICLSSHKLGNNSSNLNNIESSLSSTKRKLNNLVYVKTNISHNMNNNNNIYIKKSIHKDNKIINHKRITSLINNCYYNSINFNKEHSTNVSSSKKNLAHDYNNNTTNKINNENKKFTRNKKINLKSKFNCSKKADNITKTNPNVNNNEGEINYQFIINNDLKNNLINNNGNINISIGKNNINIKDSILHIDKIYIKKENNKSKNNSIQKLYGNENEYHVKKPIEIKVEKNIIKVGEKNNKQKKGKIKTMASHKEINSNNMINVRRNFNLFNNNKNNKESKYKYN